MPITITKEQLTALNPCDLDRRIALFGRRKTTNVKQALAGGATIKDVLWVAQRLGHKNKCIRFALLVAQRAAHHDKSGKSQACIDAAHAYVADASLDNLAELKKARSAANAAYAAYAAAYAANAAYAADAAAYAANAANAADAAAYAANAAYAAANAAYAAYAARQAEIEEQKKIMIEVFG